MSDIKDQPIIGIVGGVGPYAGLDLNKKIFDQTIASSDQDHLKIILISSSSEITDRTSYLEKIVQGNPADGIIHIIEQLANIGADVIGIPCNTSHVPEIFDVIVSKTRKKNKKVIIKNMIEEVLSFLIQHYPQVKNIGLIGTTGTVKSKVYSTILSEGGFNVVYPDLEIQQNYVHPSIYDKRFGVKSKSNPVTDIAIEKFKYAIKHVIKKGAELIILGCTEVPLAIKQKKILSVPLIDPTLILARALIKEVAGDKLKKLKI